MFPHKMLKSFISGGGKKVEKIKLVRADLKILLADYKITLIFTTKKYIFNINWKRGVKTL